MARVTAFLILVEAVLGVLPFLFYGYADAVSGMSGGAGLVLAIVAMLMVWAYVLAARLLWRGWSKPGRQRGLSIAVAMGAVFFGIGLFFTVTVAGCASIVNCGAGEGRIEAVLGIAAFVLFFLVDVFAASLIWYLPGKPTNTA